MLNTEKMKVENHFKVLDEEFEYDKELVEPKILIEKFEEFLEYIIFNDELSNKELSNEEVLNEEVLNESEK